MATPKEYAYYIKGNKIAIAEKNTSFDNDPNSRNYGPGAKDVQWESPLSDVTDGLEIQYSYAPTYFVANSAIPDAKFFCNGWFVDAQGYVNIARTNFDWDGAIAVASGISADKWIYIGGSDRWQGVHKIKSVGTELYQGFVQLYTKVNLPPRYSGSTTMDFDTDRTIAFSQAEDYFSTNDYIFITSEADPAASVANTGLFKISNVVSGEITVSDIYSVGNTTSAQTSSEDHVVPQTATLIDETRVCKGYNATYDPLYIVSAEVMEDESFELDLPRYLSRAVEFYMRAKIAEEEREIDLSLYYMREFKKQVEKHNTSKGSSYRQIQGFWGLR